MVSLERQLAAGQLVCPRTQQTLSFQGACLRTSDGAIEYPVVHGVPVLLAEPDRIRRELDRASGSMASEYAAPPRSVRALWSVPERWVGDRRTAPSRAAFARVFDALPADALCLSVGGGPLRAHSSFVNLNIGLFPNVDVVGDGYALPYSENSIDALHCEAVLEHMEYPQRAVDEMFRVTRPGARAWVATPFLQMFHAYPDHYQNFTLGGHVRLFERAGFTIEEAGACVGPTFMLRDLLQGYLRHIVPGGRFGRVLSRVAGLALLPFLFVDDLVGRRPASVVLASTTFLVARKPPGNLDPSGGIP